MQQPAPNLSYQNACSPPPQCLGAYFPTGNHITFIQQCPAHAPPQHPYKVSSALTQHPFSHCGPPKVMGRLSTTNPYYQSKLTICIMQILILCSLPILGSLSRWLCPMATSCSYLCAQNSVFSGPLWYPCATCCVCEIHSATWCLCQVP
jgi:hypothetical protein